jgi:hypothetical protein
MEQVPPGHARPAAQPGVAAAPAGANDDREWVPEWERRPCPVVPPGVRAAVVAMRGSGWLMMLPLGLLVVGLLPQAFIDLGMLADEKTDPVSPLVWFMPFASVLAINVCWAVMRIFFGVARIIETSHDAELRMAAKPVRQIVREFREQMLMTFSLLLVGTGSIALIQAGLRLGEGRMQNLAWLWTHAAVMLCAGLGLGWWVKPRIARQLRSQAATERDQPPPA